MSKFHVSFAIFVKYVIDDKQLIFSSPKENYEQRITSIYRCKNGGGAGKPDKIEILGINLGK